MNLNKTTSFFPAALRRGAFLLPFLAAGAASQAAVVITPVSSSGPALPYAADASAADLINAGAITLAGSSVSAAHVSFPAGGINDGTTSNGLPGGNTFFEVGGGNFSPVATATYDLNVAINPFGYDLTTIRSFMGWVGPSSMAQANQTYSVEVSYVGSPAYAPLTSVSFLPFADVNGSNFDSKVSITDSGGALATGVDSVRFIFSNPLLSVAPGGGAFSGTLVREMDVFGVPSIPEPSSVLTGLLVLGAMARRRRRD